VQDPPEEVEALVGEGVGQEWGHSIDGMGAQIGAPLRDRHVGEHPFELGEERRLRQREAFDVEALRLHELGPGERRRRPIRFGDRDIVVAIRRIA